LTYPKKPSNTLGLRIIIDLSKETLKYSRTEEGTNLEEEERRFLIGWGPRSH
jgi:hypothetical protein